jgi:hypothetical protein
LPENFPAGKFFRKGDKCFGVCVVIGPCPPQFKIESRKGRPVFRLFDSEKIDDLLLSISLVVENQVG